MDWDKLTAMLFGAVILGLLIANAGSFNTLMAGSASAFNSVAKTIQLRN